MPKLYGPLYHYTNEETVPQILTQEGISFRMTRIDDFDDKYEGKTIEIYYDLALERLCKTNILSEEQRLLLSQVKLPEKHLFIFSSSSCKLAKPEEAIPYVICFSKKEKDPYMFEKYLKETNRGCSMGFYSDLLNVIIVQGKQIKHSGNGYKFYIQNVLYGEEIANDLENYIKGLFECAGGNPTEDEVKNWIIPFVEMKLSNMQYCSKLNKYKDENEARLVLLVSGKENNTVDPLQSFRTEEKNGKHYLYITLPHHAFCAINPSDTLAEDMNVLSTIIKNNGYQF